MSKLDPRSVLDGMIAHLTEKQWVNHTPDKSAGEACLLSALDDVVNERMKEATQKERWSEKAVICDILALELPLIESNLTRLLRFNDTSSHRDQVLELIEQAKVKLEQAPT